jgi:hypothetical protein
MLGAGLNDVKKRRILFSPGLELQPLGRSASRQSLSQLHADVNLNEYNCKGKTGGLGENLLSLSIYHHRWHKGCSETEPGSQREEAELLQPEFYTASNAEYVIINTEFKHPVALL